MNKGSIKCSRCNKWNNTEKHNPNQKCSKCGNELDHSSEIDPKLESEKGFLDNLPPYAKFIFLALVAIIGGIIVFALA